MERPWSGAASGLCGAGIDESLKTGKESPERVREHVKTRILELEEGRFWTGTRQGGNLNGRKEESPRKSLKLKVFHGTKGLCNIIQHRMLEERGPLPKRKETGTDNTRLCAKKSCPAVGWRFGRHGRRNGESEQGSQRRRKQQWEQRGGGARERVEMNRERVRFWAVSCIHFWW